MSKYCEPLEARTLMAGNGYGEQDLVSNGFSSAAHTDSHLVNPWGLVNGPRGIEVANADAGFFTGYDGNGANVGGSVRVPGHAGAQGHPTGIVFNADPTKFLLPSGKSATFIAVTEDGTIDGWNNLNLNKTVEVAADRSADHAVYKGVALARFNTKPYLYVANFSAGRVDVFDATFKRRLLPGRFADSNLPRGFAPFNVQLIGSQLFVMFAARDPSDVGEELHRAHAGLVDVFNTNGTLVKRFTTAGTLNAPWGIARAPANFGDFSNDILVGNFGDGRISAFNPTTGKFLGQLSNASGTPLAIDGLWGLAFGNGKGGNRTNGLYFTAGPNHEEGGLYGRLVALDALGYPT
jgi:uncharacterized protein (TIGR03118 family)